MNVKMNQDGEYVVTLTRAEAHVIAWGGKTETVNALDWDLRHSIVEIEDALPDSDYAALYAATHELPNSPRYPVAPLEVSTPGHNS